jgi:hypothetical protein
MQNALLVLGPGKNHMQRIKGTKGWPLTALVAGLALALMTAAAQAQMNQQTQMNNAARVGQNASHQGEDKADKPKANDKAYNAALHNLPDKQYDPWHGVR